MSNCTQPEAYESSKAAPAHFKLFQILDAEHADLMFRGYAVWEQKRQRVIPELYCEVYSGEKHGDSSVLPEIIFSYLNQMISEGKVNLRSMSVSDVIVINDKEAFFCDNIGFRNVTETFLQNGNTAPVQGRTSDPVHCDFCGAPAVTSQYRTLYEGTEAEHTSRYNLCPACSALTNEELAGGSRAESSLEEPTNAFEDFLAAKNDAIYNAVFQAMRMVAAHSLEETEQATGILEWDLSLIAPIAEHIENTLRDAGLPYCYPYHHDDMAPCYANGDCNSPNCPFQEAR